MRVVGTSPNVKQCNVNLVKWFLLERGGATKPEIAQHTGDQSDDGRKDRE